MIYAHITGSHQPRLRVAVAQSLAGRTSLLTLLPLSISELYYLRTEKGVEIDLILRKEGYLYPFEIKSAMTPVKEYGKNLKAFMEAEKNAKDPRIVYAGEPYPSFDNVAYINYQSLKQALE